MLSYFFLLLLDAKYTLIKFANSFPVTYYLIYHFIKYSKIKYIFSFLITNLYFCNMLNICKHDSQGKENLVLPLVILGAISVIGGLSGLRLPETLHYRLPQTVEEGELFGKDWTCADCIRCVPTKYIFDNYLIIIFCVSVVH